TGYVVRDIRGQRNAINADQFESEKRVTGIGGVFFRSNNPEALRAWYGKHLGLGVDSYGTNFEWRQAADSTKKGFTQWSPFHHATPYFGDSSQQYMINYRVQDLEHLLLHLSEEGVVVVDEMQTTEYGKFIHILDLEGNKVELWEPIDEEYELLVEGRTM
ncbi:MAG: VOC family protein, partial [Bacteroidota bacterium]